MHCIYIGHRGHSIYLALYVDSIYLALYVGLVMSDSKDILTEFLNDLKETFEIKIKEPRFFVGVEIECNRERRTIKLHQSSYIAKIVEKFRMDYAKTSTVPVQA